MPTTEPSPPQPDAAPPPWRGGDVRRGGGAEIFFGPHGVRAGWRILGYVLLLSGLIGVLSPLVQALGNPNPLLRNAIVFLIASLVSGWVMLAAVDRRTTGALGFAAEPAAVRDSAAGLGVGGAMLLLAVLLLAVANMTRWVADTGSAPEYVAALARAFAFFAVAAAMEEAMFRGYAFQALVQGIGAWPAVLASSALFAWGHAGNPSVTWVALANIFLAGVMLAVAYLKTRSLWFATGVHLGWNWTMASLLGFPVSGLTEFDTPLYDVREMGPDAVTGGAFGPEAGIAATLAIVAGTVWMWRTRRIGESERMRALRPLVDSRLAPGTP